MEVKEFFEGYINALTLKDEGYSVITKTSLLTAMIALLVYTVVSDFVEVTVSASSLTEITSLAPWLTPTVIVIIGLVLVIPVTLLITLLFWAAAR